MSAFVTVNFLANGKDILLEHGYSEGEATWAGHGLKIEGGKVEYLEWVN